MKTKEKLETLNQIANAVHALAWEKGWHCNEEDRDAFIERCCNNLHDEVSELHEHWRNNRLTDVGKAGLTNMAEEFADILIRVLDNCRKLGVDIQTAVVRKHNFNKQRAFRHGGKRS